MKTKHTDRIGSLRYLVIAVAALAAMLLGGATASAVSGSEPLDQTLVTCAELPAIWTGAHIVTYDYDAETIRLEWDMPDGSEVHATISGQDSDCEGQPGLSAFVSDTREGQRQTNVADCNDLRELVSVIEAARLPLDGDDMVVVPAEVIIATAAVESQVDLREKLGGMDTTINMDSAKNVLSGFCSEPEHQS